MVRFYFSPISLPLVPYWYLYSWEMFKWHGFSTWAALLEPELKWGRIKFISLWVSSLTSFLPAPTSPVFVNIQLSPNSPNIFYYSSFFVLTSGELASSRYFFYNGPLQRLGELFWKGPDNKHWALRAISVTAIQLSLQFGSIHWRYWKTNDEAGQIKCYCGRDDLNLIYFSYITK